MNPVVGFFWVLAVTIVSFMLISVRVYPHSAHPYKATAHKIVHLNYNATHYKISKDTLNY